jgi:sigma-B regulation protein RsbU (phosphoserine phosphatase)
VGGDFYDFISLSGNRLGIAIGDVSDHGVPAALFMALAATLMRAEARREASPCAVLMGVNNQLLERNASGMFVTMLYGVLDLTSRAFTYARAGHELPILLDQDGQSIAQPRGVGQLMGILEAPSLEEQTLVLPPGGTMMLFTDGVTEAADARGVLFGKDRLLDALRRLRHQPGQEICTGLLAQVSEHLGSDMPQDDITTVIVQAQGT